jgi:predicted RND superfamily exporter protein
VVDDTVHFLVRYRRRRSEGDDACEATTAAILGTGRAITLTTILLSTSFVTLLMSDTAMAAHFGAIAALVCVLALVADLVVLPAALRHPIFRAASSSRRIRASQGSAHSIRSRIWQ